MLHRVRQSLLHDPVRREPGPAVDPSRVPHDLERHGKSAGGDTVDEPLDVLHARLGCQPLAQVARAQEAQQPPHLSERAAGGRADGLEHLLGGLGIPLGRVSTAVGLHDDHRKAVGDDIVHLAGDALPLGRRGNDRLLVTLGGKPPVALLELRDVDRTGTTEVAENPAGDAPPNSTTSIGYTSLRRLMAPSPPIHCSGSEHGAEQAGRKADPARPGRAVARDGGEGHQDRDVPPQRARYHP